MLCFNIHGVKLEINKGSKPLRKYLQRELKFFLSEKSNDPDIMIDFVSHLVTPSELKAIGNLVEFGNNQFYVRLNDSRILFPINNIGKTIKIKSEVSIPLERFLESIIEPTVYYKLLTKNFGILLQN